MGLIEWLTGWEYIENASVDKEIISLAKQKADKIFTKVAGNTMHNGNVYITMRGERIASYIPSFKFHISGKTFVYRIKSLKYKAGEGNGHGYYTGGGMKIWKKLKHEG
jgi:hypothetical protein